MPLAVARQASAASSGGRTGLVIGASPNAVRDEPGKQKPRSRAGQGSFTSPDLLARYLTWRASQSAQITTERPLGSPAARQVSSDDANPQSRNLSPPTTLS